MDQTSFVSLAARVCGEDSSLTFANSQNSVLTEVRDYMNTIVILGVEFFGVGQLLCAVVLFVWLLFVVQELQDALAFASVLCALPRSRRTIIALDGEAYAVESISIKRLAFLMGVVLCRLTIAVILGYAGALWLCNTRGLTDLVLNAAALAFVMDLDELINSTLTPLSASALVERLEPLRRPKGLRWRGLGLHSIVGFVAVVAFTWFFFTRHALPMGEKMINIEFELCRRGSIDFVAEQNAAMGLPLVVPTEPFEEATPGVDSWFKHVVAENIDSPILNGTPAPIASARMLPSKQSFVSTLAQGVADQAVPACSDVLSTPNYPDIIAHLTWLRYNYGHLNASSCQDFEEHCGDQEGFVLRFVCARTCGCANPFSGLYYQTGCPNVCVREREARLRRPSCEDVDSESPSARLIGTQRFIEHFSLRYGNLFPPGFMQNGCSDLANMGEDAPHYWTKHSLCSSGLAALGSLQSFCPAACGCADSHGSGFRGAGCPESCARGAGAVANISADECVAGLCPHGEVMGAALAYPGQALTCGLFDSMFYSGAYTENMCRWSRGQLQHSCCRASAAVQGCADHHGEAILAAASAGYTISGCGDAVAFCSNATLQQLCPWTCGACPSTSTIPAAGCSLCSPGAVVLASVIATDAGNGTGPVSCESMAQYVSIHSTQEADQCAWFQSSYAHCCGSA
jgi:hypothetical protein